MKKLICILGIAALVSSCAFGVKGNGNVQRQTRKVDNFDKLEVSGGFDVFLKQGEEPSLVIEADENLLEYIRSDVRGGELEIESDRPIRSAKKMALYITLREAREIELSGACTLKSEGEIRSQELDISASGASECDLQLRCRELNLDLSGACEMKLSGAAEKLRIDASGACEVNAFDLKTARCDIDMSGAGEADVYVTEILNIETSGASEIRYMGDPKDIKQSSSGASSIKPYTNK